MPKSFQGRITDCVHLRLAVRFQMTDKITQHRKMRQTANATALDDLCALGISDSLEHLHIPQEGVGVLIKASHKLLT